jgi:hypothetical protein
MKTNADYFEAEDPVVERRSVFLLDAREAGDVLRFKRLCHEKFGRRFQPNENFRHQAVDVLLAGVEDIGK